MLQIVNVVSHIRTTGDDLLEAFRTVDSRPRKVLRHTVDGLKAPFEIGPIESDALLDAINARNFIAHEFANVGPARFLNPKKIRELRLTLREKLRILVKGDSIASCWVHEVEEKEPAPVHLLQYNAWVMTWVFGDAPRLSQSDPGDVRSLCAYARIPYKGIQKSAESIVLEYGHGHGRRTSLRGHQVIHIDLTLVDDAARHLQAKQVLRILSDGLDCLEARQCIES